MDILLIAQYIGNIEELENSNNRFLYLAKLMQEKHKVEIVTSSFVHQKKRIASFVPNSFNGCKITALHECGYKKNISLGRIISNRKLAENLKLYLKKRKKPDLIYCAVPSLDFAYVAAKYAKKKGIKFIIDIQDLWPEAFKMAFKIPIVSDLIFWPLNKQADIIYNSADTVVGVSNTYCERAMLVNKTAKHMCVFIGTELEKFDEYKENTNCKKETDKMILAYCGSLSDSYDLKVVIDALQILKHKMYNIEFWVMGDGLMRNELEAYAKQSEIETIFWGRLDYPEMCKKLSCADMCINPIKKGSAATIINKHADYAAAGIAVINTQESSEYRTLLEKYNCGINCICGSAHSVAEAIEFLYLNPTVRMQMGNNARKMAEDLFDRKKSYVEILESL